MRLFPLLAASLLLAACSETAVETKAKTAPKPLEPVTGRQAFQSTYPSARGWATDAQPFRVRSMNLAGITAAEGTAGLWEVTYTSVSRAQARVFTWSAIEDASLHQGVYGGPAQSFTGGGQERSFPPAALKTDTSEALKKAIEESEEYMQKPGQKPPVNFLLELTPRFPNPVWRVLWGVSPGTAERQVFVDASTGAAVGKE